MSSLSIDEMVTLKVTEQDKYKKMLQAWFQRILIQLHDNIFFTTIAGVFRFKFQEADIALASLAITHKREQAVYFTKPFMNTGISIMIKKPEREKPGVFSFMDPLSIQVWGCVIGGYFAVSFILYMVGRFSPYEWQDVNSTGFFVPSNTYSFVNTLWFSLGALMQQGPDIYPR